MASAVSRLTGIASETDEDEITSRSSVDVEMEEGTIDQPKDEAPTPMPSRVIQPEEATGPKSRLVIHKLMLINFKSYAGRQEIGPFHKVMCSVMRLSL
jgi:structural maintenance of chromosome 4